MCPIGSVVGRFSSYSGVAATLDNSQLNREQCLSCSMRGLKPAGPQETKAVLPSLAAAVHGQDALPSPAAATCMPGKGAVRSITHRGISSGWLHC